MKRTIILFVGIVLIVGIGTILFLSKDKLLHFQIHLPKIHTYKNPVSKSSIEATCNSTDMKCVVKNNTVTKATLTTDESKYIQTKPTGTQKNVFYASNVAKAVTAIRNYTQIQDLDLAPVQATLGSVVTFYCTKDNKCWGYNNQSGKVIN